MNDISIKTAYDLFIFDRQTFCSESTIVNYQNTLRYFMDYLAESRDCTIDDLKLSELSSGDIKRYIVSLRQRQANAVHPLKKAKGKLSQRTIRNYTVDLKTFFSYLADEEYCDNKFSGVRIIKAERKMIIPLFLDEIETLDKLFNLKTSSGCRNYCMVHLMLEAGLRFNEVRSLRCQDVNFANRYIHVVYSKGNKERTIPMASSLKKSLYSYIHVFRSITKSDNIFLDQNGEPISENAMKSLFARLKKRSGIDRLHPHLLRHTFATSYIMSGGSVEMLRILLGHESIETTQKYMHVATVYSFKDNVYTLDPIFYSGKVHR